MPIADINSQLLSSNFGASATTSLVQAQFGGASGTSSAFGSSLLQAANQPTISPNLTFSQDGVEKSLNDILQANQRLSSDFNLLSSLGGFDSYANTNSLLEASFSTQQAQFDQLV